MRKEDLLTRTANGNVIIDRDLDATYPVNRKRTDETTEKSFTIFKADEDKRLVFGWASVAITVDGETLEDMQHDMIDPEDLEEAAYEYVLNFRDTGEEHLPGYRKKGKLVESCVFTPEKQKAMGIPEGIVPVAWWIGFKIDDEATWQRIKDGTYKMFSIEGKAQREPIEKSNTIAKSFDEILEKFNPYHDRMGRFTGPGGGAGGPVAFFTNTTKDPNKQHWADKAKLREQERQSKIIEGKLKDLDAKQDEMMDRGEMFSDKWKKAVDERKQLEAELEETQKPINTKPKETTPKDSDSTTDFKAIDTAGVKEMKKEMGATYSKEDIAQMNSHGGGGYFGTGHSFHLNKDLRNGKKLEDLSEDDRKTCETLDKNMKPITRDIKLSRMVDTGFFEQFGIDPAVADRDDSEMKKAVGKVYGNKGYTSTSYDIGENVFTSRKYKLNISAPKGTKAVIRPGHSEAEILLARNTGMVVKGIRKVKKNNWWGDDIVYEVDVEVIP